MTHFILENRELWKQKARAFVTRTHRHLWGKNNEDPLVFLFRQGFSNDFIKQMHLGWNKHGQERDLGKWGLDRPGEPASRYFFPAGIVFPYIIDRDLLSVVVIPMDPQARPVLLPGSSRTAVSLGPEPFARFMPTDFFQALKTFQDSNGETGVVLDLS